MSICQCKLGLAGTVPHGTQGQDNSSELQMAVWLAGLQLAAQAQLIELLQGFATVASHRGLSLWLRLAIIWGRQRPSVTITL